MSKTEGCTWELASCAPACTLRCAGEQRRQDAKDGDHNEQFNEGKGVNNFGLLVSGCGFEIGYHCFFLLSLGLRGHRSP
jgi:hypothetical protein